MTTKDTAIAWIKQEIADGEEYLSRHPTSHGELEQQVNRHNCLAALLERPQEASECRGTSKELLQVQVDHCNALERIHQLTGVLIYARDLLEGEGYTDAAEECRSALDHPPPTLIPERPVEPPQPVASGPSDADLRPHGYAPG